jgi:aerobic-type carbon monoxide dehydrogenase small subunit (CoxS/CutS family)
MAVKNLSFRLNGESVTCKVEDNETLLAMLRERFALTSVKEGCSIGECGVCTVLIDDEPHYGCLTLASKIDGRDVKTVEYLAQDGIIREGAVQCGFCTPGMLLVAYSLLLKNAQPTDEEIKQAMSGNLCRCTGYVQIVEAIKDAARVLESRT